MNMSSKQQEKLIELLRELFQLNQPDLDFGLSRIMHTKSQEIEQFLNEDLLTTIQQRLGGNKAEKVEKAAYERERQNAIDCFQWYSDDFTESHDFVGMALLTARHLV